MIARALVATIATNHIRPRRPGLILVVALLLVVGLPAAARAQTPDYVPGEVIVKFKPGVSAAQRTAAVGEGPRRASALPHAVVLRGRAVEETVRDLERDPRVAWAEPNAYRKGGALPNDALFAQQWALPGIHAPEAWERTTGSPDVKVAVVDSGINFGQPDLGPNLWRNPGESGGGRESNGVDDDANGFVDDWRGWDFVQGDNDPSDNYGHGTRIAGVIAGRGDNGLGVAGVAWRASVIPVRVLDNNVRGMCDETAAGMAYAVRAGARIVNLSLGMDVPCQAERDVIDGAPGTLFVVAAMNDGRDADARPVYPCSLPSPNIVCVAASDSDDRLAEFSNYGASSVDLAAPGVGIVGPTLNWGPTETLFSDSFETPLAGKWVTGGTPNTWDRTPFMPTRTGGFSLSNALLGTYANDTDNWVRLAQSIDLRGKSDCAAILYVRHALGVFDFGRPFEEQDHLIAEASRDGVDWSRRPDVQAGTNAEWERWVVDLSRLEGRATGGLRFHLVTNASGVFGGIALDDLRILCAPPLTDYTGAPDEFATDFGTSVAAPHVSGVAALMLSLEPGLTAAELKRRLLASVDPQPSLAGKTVSGGRLNAARALVAAPVPPAGSTPAAVSRAAVASLLKEQVRAIAQALASVRVRALLRRGGLIGARLFAPAAGRLSLKMKSGGRVIAAGGCSVPQADRCPVTARFNRRGRSLLRHTRRPRVTFVLAFAPTSGPAVVQRATARLGLKPRHGGS